MLTTIRIANGLNVRKIAQLNAFNVKKIAQTVITAAGFDIKFT
jgi:hypothetical protein